MTIFIECLKRLYRSNSLTETKLRKLLADGKITQEELSYILD